MFRTLVAILVAISLAADVSGNPAPGEDRSVTLLGDDWMPFYGTPSPGIEGYQVEIAREILAAKGYRLDFRVVPWSRALTMVREGAADCLPGVVEADVPDYPMTKKSFGIDEVHFFVRDSDPWKYEGEPSLQDRMLGIIGDYAYSNDYLGHYLGQPENQSRLVVVRSVNPVEKLVQLLENQRINVFLEHSTVASHFLAQGDYAVRSAGRLGDTNPMLFACSPANPERSKLILDMLDEGIIHLRNSGRLQTILDKYGLKDWQ